MSEIVEGVNDIRNRLTPMYDTIQLAYLKKKNAEDANDTKTIEHCDRIMNLQLEYIKRVVGTK